MKVSKLKAHISRLWVTVPGENEGDPDEKVWVDYRPGELTLEVADELRNAVETGFESDVAFIMLNRVLAGWDLEDEEGNRLGVSEREIKTVPLSFLGLIMAGIEEDARPNPKRDATSAGSSQQTEEPEASQNGISSSEQPTGSLVSPGSS